MNSYLFITHLASVATIINELDIHNLFEFAKYDELQNI
jgi:hypothetical protein